MKKLFLTTLIACLILLPAAAFAESMIRGGAITGSNTLDYVKQCFGAQGGSSEVAQYTYRAQHGDKPGEYFKYNVKLLADVTVYTGIEISDYGNVEIDLNGHTMTNVSNSALFHVLGDDADAALIVRCRYGDNKGTITSATGHTVRADGQYAVFTVNPEGGEDEEAFINHTGTGGSVVLAEHGAQAYLNCAVMNIDDLRNTVIDRNSAIFEHTGAFEGGTEERRANRPFTMRLRVRNAYGSDTRDITCLIYTDDEPPMIVAAYHMRGYVGQAFSRQLATTAGKKLKLTSWRADGLPAGIALNAKTGLLSGKPEVVGSYEVTIYATNQSFTLEKTITIEVDDSPITEFLPYDTVALPVNGSFEIASHDISGSIFDGSTVFKSADESVATVNAKGVITAKKRGWAEIVITVLSEESIAQGQTNAASAGLMTPKSSVVAGDTVRIVVHVVGDGEAVSGVTVSSGGALAPGKRLALTAQIAPETALHKKVYWSSSDENVAIVNKMGVVTGVAPGEAKITAMATSGVTGVATVTVSDVVKEITLSQTTRTLGVGERAQITATATPIGAQNADIAWSSDQPDIAYVEDGQITGIAVGEAVITARNPATGVSATCAVTVVAGKTDAQYVLAVENGRGGGAYPAGAAVHIKADAPESGYRFKQWTSAPDGLIADPNSAETALIMPASAAQVTATYERAACRDQAVPGSADDGHRRSIRHRGARRSRRRDFPGSGKLDQRQPRRRDGGRKGHGDGGRGGQSEHYGDGRDVQRKLRADGSA